MNGALKVAILVVGYGIFYSYSEDVPFLLGKNTNVPEAADFLKDYDIEGSEVCFRVNLAQWHYATNMTDLQKRKMIEEQTLKAKFDKLVWKRAAAFDWTHINDPDTRRQLKMLTTNTRASLPDDKYNEIYHLISEMKDIYATTRICPYKADFFENEISYCDLDLDDVHTIIARSRNPIELAHIWREVHNKMGPPMKNKFMRYLELANQASRLNGFSDYGEEMRYMYEDINLEDDLTESMHKLLPLYKELFTFVRKRLLQRYGDHVIRPDGPLPAHILGNLWGQDWTNIADMVLPYRDYSDLDVTDEILRQGFTPLRMFQMAEEFFTSMGLKPMPPEFWRFSLIERPNGRKVQCTASAWDFCNNIDYRIKQCTEVDMKNLVTIHHEMAHVEYYLYYADKPYLYREGANPGFHEGLANAIVLSVFNPKHLWRVGLFNNKTDTVETNINFLMLMALKKVAYAPFAYLIDQWRYQIAEDGVNRMNADWWDLRLRYQGIIPPVPRSEAHFDAGTKRHVPADLPYMKYFVALLLEFQIYEAMCRAGRHVGPLHTCDVYRSREAGRVLMEVMRAGRSKHWREVMKILTRGETDKITADAMLNYFQPLILWLREQNRDERVVGWTTYKEDKALFQPLVLYGTSSVVRGRMFVLITALIFTKFNFILP
ncbi:angiotensin-converting enzyme-like [Diabrotica virgifera virgifera]|uniref:Angiotensin-converting enzyme n=1 Tax=Diabrotica virgifera virgifera TaxID=50390 RepID=A0A6P7FP22_DIAVI|nr:angiotensin-converting enzyme-like [Diabrotica virgifera virgifera]